MATRIIALMLVSSILNTITVNAQGYWKRVHGDNVTDNPTSGTYSPANSPHGRYASAVMQDTSGTFWLYGGEERNDLWRFNPEINQWMLVDGEFNAFDEAAVNGTQGVADEDNQPGAVVFGHPSWGDSLGNLWLYGLNGLNNMWKYDISEGMWTWVTGSNANGPAVFGEQTIHSDEVTPGMVNETDCHWTDSEGNLWLYTEFDGNLWKFDPELEQWAWMHGSGDQNIDPVYGELDQFSEDNYPGQFVACPNVGTLYTMWITSDDHLWMMINRDNLTNLQVELWEFSPELNQWRCRRIDEHDFGAEQTYPEACVNENPDFFPIVRTELRTEWVDGCDHLYLFGGASFCNSGNILYNDIWRYDPETNCYTYIRGGDDLQVLGTQGVFDPDNSPPPSSGGQSWQNENGFYLMGGLIEFTGEATNDVWLYSPDTVVADFSEEIDCLTVDFENLSTTGCNYFDEIMWDFGDGNTSTELNPSHTFDSNGIYSVTLTASNCSWHTDTIVKEIIVDCGFSVNVPSDTICAGDCTTLVASSSQNSGDVDFQWQSPLNSTNDSVEVCPTTTETFSVIATTSIGDIDSTETTVTVLPQPEVELGNDTTICGGTLELDAQNEGLNYLWQDGSQEQTFTVTESGTYQVEVSNGFCSVSDSVTVTIDGPQIELGPDTTACSPNFLLGEEAQEGWEYLWQDGSQASTFAVADTGLYHVTVTDSAGCSVSDSIFVGPGSIELELIDQISICQGDSTLLQPGLENDSDISWSTGETSSEIWVSEEGTYLLIAEKGICEAQDSVVVSIESVEAGFTAENTEGCSPLSVQFVDQSISSGSVASWSWSFENGHTSEDQNPDLQFFESGVYEVNLQVTTVSGCEASVVEGVSITVHPNVEADFSIEPESPETDEEVSFIDQSTNADSWYWNFDDNSFSKEQNPDHYFEFGGEYSVLLVASNQWCSDTARLHFFVEEELIYYVPNAFTPNGDGVNDVFLPVFSSGFNPEGYLLRIFNRWGQVIFVSDHHKVGWDGTIPKCGLVPNGVYVWQIEFRQQSGVLDEIRGHVNVIH